MIYSIYALVDPELLKENIMPHVRVLDSVTEHPRARELEWILHFDSQGSQLTNILRWGEAEARKNDK
jgi:hypothetical protein